MDWKNFVSSLVGHVAWPTAVVGIVVCFRTPIKNLIDRIRHFEGFGADVSFFERQARDLAIASMELVEQIVEAEVGSEVSEEYEPESALKRLARMGRIRFQEWHNWGNELKDHQGAPKTVIAEAWPHLEAEVLKFAGAPVGARLSEVVESLVRRGEIPESVGDQIKRLKSVRNEVVHNPKVEVPDGFAYTYLWGAIEEIVILKSLP